MLTPENTTIRKLIQSDLAFALSVGKMSGWNQLPSDWNRLLATEPDGCFLIECDGKPAGTATTTTYGTDLGWIGMVLVHPDFRRCGLATALLNRCLSYLIEERGVQCVKLDATPDGMKVYEKLGFQEEFELARWSGSTVVDKGELNPTSEPDLTTMIKLDTAAFGTDRIDYLQRLSRDSRVRVISGQGYSMVREGRIALYLGPMVSNSSDAAEKLASSLLHSQKEMPVFWDIPENNRQAVALAGELGFKRVRKLIRMWAGNRNTAGSTTLQWAIGAPETG